MLSGALGLSQLQGSLTGFLRETPRKVPEEGLTGFASSPSGLSLQSQGAACRKRTKRRAKFVDFVARISQEFEIGESGKKSGRLFRHVGDELLVKFASGVVAHFFQSLAEGRHFDETGHIAAGADGELNKGNFQPEGLVIMLLETRSFLFHPGGPFLEIDDEIDPFLHSNTPDSEHFGDIDDADAAALHVSAIEFGASTDEFLLVDKGNVGEIVGYEAVVALDEGESALALPDAALPFEEGADAFDVHQGAVFDGRGGKFVFEGDGGEIDEMFSDQRGAEDRQTGLLRDAQDRPGGDVTAREDDAWDTPLHQLAQHLVLFLLIKAAQVGHLCGSEDLDTFVREKLIETGQGEGRTVYASLEDDAVDPGGSRHQFQFQFLAVCLKEMGDGDAFRAFGGRLHGN